MGGLGARRGEELVVDVVAELVVEEGGYTSSQTQTWCDEDLHTECVQVRVVPFYDLSWGLSHQTYFFKWS